MLKPAVVSRAAFIGMFVLLLGPSRSFADPFIVPLGAFSSSATIVDFAEGIDGQPLPYSENGATFLSFVGTQANLFGLPPLGINPFLFLGGLADEPATLTVLFAEPVTMAGAMLSLLHGGIGGNVELFTDPAGLLSLGQVDLPFLPSGTAGFMGFGSTLPFTRAEINFDPVRSFGSFRIEDFRFEGTDPVPEPGTISLTLLGLGLLARRVRRRHHAPKA